MTRTRGRLSLLLALPAALLFTSLVACSSQSTQQSNLESANAGAVNARCPIEPEDPVNPGVYTMWKGQKVAFCCPGCIDEWDRKTEDQKAALLEKAK